MKKLGSIENLDDFILAIANGADIDGTFKGKPLVEYYLDNLSHTFTTTLYSQKKPIEIENTFREQEDFKKLEVLINLGVDMEKIFSPVNGCGYYVSSIYSTIRTLILLNTVLSSDNAQKSIIEDNYSRSLLSEVREMLVKAQNSIEQTEILKKIGDSATQADVCARKERVAFCNNSVKKYELTEEKAEIIHNSEYIATVYRIRALKNFQSKQMNREVCAGDMGGYIEKEANLSQEDNCWVDEDAVVIQNARVIDNAYVCGKAEISKNAIISENSLVDDNSKISGNAILKGSSSVHGESIIKGFVTLDQHVEVKNVILSSTYGSSLVYLPDAEHEKELDETLQKTIGGTVSI